MFRKQMTFTVLAAMIALVFTANDAEAGRRHRRHHCCHGSYQQTSYTQNACCDSGSYGYSMGHSTSSGCGTNGCAGGACGIPAHQTGYSTGSSYQSSGQYQSGQNQSGQYQSGQMGSGNYSGNMNRNDANRNDVNVNRNVNPSNLNRTDANRADVNVNGRSQINAGQNTTQDTDANVDIVDPPAPAPSTTTPDAPAPAPGT